MLEKLFEQLEAVPSVPSAKKQSVQLEDPYIKAVPSVPSVLSQKIETEIIHDESSGIETTVYVYPRFVICYTPNGKGLQVLARDAEHEAFLLRMNQPRCGSCQNFEPIHEHGKGSGFCKAGVMPSGVCHWSETAKSCGEFKRKDGEKP